ncbi:unannotated protein [freshwater metagenome]|uniref:Unannotated protein n=1 Tax=freshwater metagenome TaxID=449393 RepID=A0A6J6VM03_9ZZZZ
MARTVVEVALHVLDPTLFIAWDALNGSAGVGQEDHVLGQRGGVGFKFDLNVATVGLKEQSQRLVFGELDLVVARVVLLGLSRNGFDLLAVSRRWLIAGG